MTSALQDVFNQQVFTPERYELIGRYMTRQLGARAVRLCETPVFLDAGFHDGIIQAGHDIAMAAMAPDVLAQVDRFIDPAWRMPGDIGRPTMVCVDFAIAQDAAGKITPQLIELQGVSSVYALQAMMSRAYSRGYGLDGQVAYLPDGMTPDSYVDMFRDVVLAGHDPKHVVLMEIDPWEQKTAIDFRATEKMLGIKVVGIDEISRRGDKLFYDLNGQETEIRRIYNRIIPEEFSRYARRDDLAFRFTDKLDVEWVVHPAWSFLISKCSMPFLKHPAVPQSRFLNDGAALPQDLQNYVLKPLLSFAGAGVKVDVTQADIDAIPADRRGDYMLQKKVDYAPFLKAPDGTQSKAEVRVMYLMQGNDLKPAILFARVSRSKMMNAGFNKTDKWVGVAPVFRAA